MTGHKMVFIMQISKQEKFKIINISSIAAACLLVIILLYLPAWKRISRDNREIKILKNIVEKLSRINNDPASFENKKNRIMENLNAIRGKVTLQPMIPQVLEQITKPIKELGISLISITPIESIKRESDTEISKEAFSEPGGYTETPVELSLQADYKQFGLYLDKLRHLPRLIVIREFVVKQNKEITPKLDIKLKISVFSYGKE